MQPEQTAAPRSREPSVAHAQPDRPTTTHVRIYTFGLLRLEWVDQHSGYAAAIPQEKLAIKDGVAALWLLKLLLSQPHRYALRDEIMEHLWPEASSSSAAKRLDNVVYALRKLLRPPGSPQVPRPQRQWQWLPVGSVSAHLGGCRFVYVACRTSSAHGAVW